LFASADQGSSAQAIASFQKELESSTSSLSTFTETSFGTSDTLNLFNTALTGSETKVVEEFFSLGIGTTQAVIGTETLASATTVAASQIAAAGATAAAISFAAKGNVFSGGYQAAFAKGGVLGEGSVQAFASGGVVSSPTLFPIRGGKTGLMGEAGPEAIVPVRRMGGGFAANAISPNGDKTHAQIVRDSAGKLVVKIPKESEYSRFAKGAVLNSCMAHYAMAFAAGAVLRTSNVDSLAAFSKGGVAVGAASSNDRAASSRAMEVLPFAAGGVLAGSGVQMIATVNHQAAASRFADGAVVARSAQASPVRFAYGGIVTRADSGMGSDFIPSGLDATTQPTPSQDNTAITVVQNIQTPDVAGFRRARAAIFNDVQSALGSSGAKT
jgi:hypothetical protein